MLHSVSVLSVPVTQETAIGLVSHTVSRLRKRSAVLPGKVKFSGSTGIDQSIHTAVLCNQQSRSNKARTTKNKIRARRAVDRCSGGETKYTSCGAGQGGCTGRGGGRETF